MIDNNNFKKEELKELIKEILNNTLDKERFFNTKFVKEELREDEIQFITKLYDKLEKEDISFLKSLIEDNLDYLIDLGIELDNVSEDAWKTGGDAAAERAEVKFILKQIKNALGWLIFNPMKLMKLMVIAYKVL